MRGRLTARNRGQLGSVLLLFGLLALALHMLASGSTTSFVSDTYTALYSGRYVAAHGIPHTDPFTILGHGRRWIDQQWLGQLILYDLWRFGGNLAVIATCLGCVALTAALLGNWLLRCGVPWPLAFGWTVLVIWAFHVFAVIRVQDLIFPAALGAAILLTRAVRARHLCPQIWLLIPLFVLWANIHGTILLMVIVTTLVIGSVGLWQWFRARDTQQIVLTGSFLVVAWLTLFATPYGFAELHYYAAVIGNPTIASHINEWQTSYPGDGKNVAYTTTILITLIAWAIHSCWSRRLRNLISGGCVVVIAGAGYSRLRYEPWALMAVAAVIAGSIQPRNLTAITRPRVGAVWARCTQRWRPVITIVAGLLTAGCIGAVAWQVYAIATAPAARHESVLHTAQVQPLNRLLSPQLRVVADLNIASALLWHDPRYAGHLAFDTRLEIYRQRDLAPLFNVLEGAISDPAQAAAAMGTFNVFVADNFEAQRRAARSGHTAHSITALALVDSKQFVPVNTDHRGDVLIARQLVTLATRRGIPLATTVANTN